MDEIQNVTNLILHTPLGGIRINPVTGLTSLFIVVFIGVFSWLGTRKLKSVPGAFQSLLEMIVEAFAGLVTDTMGEDGRKYTNFALALFLFIFLSNIVGIAPVCIAVPFFIVAVGSMLMGRFQFGAALTVFLALAGGILYLNTQHVLPFTFAEPTRDLNVPFALALLTFVMCNYAAVKKKGAWAYFKEFADPFVFMLPLNIIGELAKVVSHSFRLYGNILGGAIIIAIISELAKFIILPVGLNFFFGIFVGGIQAFVFTMLAITYIAVATATDEEEESADAKELQEVQ